MSADVLDLSAALRRAQQVAGCQRCVTASARCGPHRVADVADRLREERAAIGAELLLPAPVVLDVLSDALHDLDVLLAEMLPNHERTAR